MSLLPFVNQFILPTVISVYAAIVAFLPYTGAHPLAHKNPHASEKKVAVAQMTPTPTIEKTQKETLDKGTSNKEILEIGSRKTEQHEVSSPTPTQTTSGEDMQTISDTTPTPSPVVSTPAAVVTTITAKSTITASGKTIHLTMKYPSLGGAITGTISGDCDGSISGTYDGPSKQTLSGKGQANCPMAFMNIPVSIQYTGKLTSSTNAAITYTVTALSKTETGNTNLNLQ